MKKSNSYESWCLIFITVWLLLASGCGGGGGLPAPEVSANLSSQGGALLKEGDIKGAQAKYDEALTLDAANTESAFGAAFTRLILLSESTPSQNILQGLGQKTVTVNDLAGPSSYLSALNDVNAMTLTLDNLEEPFYGSLYSGSWQSQYHSGGFDWDCDRSYLHSEIYNADKSVKLNLVLYTYLSVTKDGVLVSQYQPESGDIIDPTEVFDCAYYSFNPADLEFTLNGDWPYYSQITSGTLKLDQIGSDSGDTVQIEFQNVVLSDYYDNEKSFTLNGVMSDTITNTNLDSSSYFPFGDPNRLGKKSIISNAVDSLTVADLQFYATDYIPLFQEIADLLTLADQDDGFQFIIPKELFFGNQDISINRADLKSLRGGVDMSLVSLYFYDSWEFPLTVGNLYDENGNQLVSTEDIINQLNDFFTLKTDNSLSQAQIKLASALQHLLDAQFLISQLNVDGILDNIPDTADGSQELEEVLSVIQASLNSEQIFSYVNPSTTIDLTSFFTNPPRNGDDVGMDPFVLEEGQITPVEAFFVKVLEGSIDLDLDNDHAQAFQSINEGFAGKVFDEFKNFIVSGKSFNADYSQSYY